MTTPATPTSPIGLDGTGDWIERFRPLRRAEVVMLRALASGEVAKVGLRRPLVPAPDVVIRAELVTVLLRGAEGFRLDEQGFQVIGAWIDGRIDMRQVAVPHGIWFYRCVFNAVPRFTGTRIQGSLSFRDCLLPGLRADECRVSEDLAINAGSTVRSDVRLVRAAIGGDLHCARLRLRSSSRAPMPATDASQLRLLADGVRVDGDVYLSGGFEAHGDVRLVGAQIGGSLFLDSARLSGSVVQGGARGAALNMDRAQVAGRVSLDGGFTAAGSVRLKQARIDGDLDCTGASFDVYGEAEFGSGSAFQLDSAWVGGALVLRSLSRPLSAASLAGAQVSSLSDDNRTWGDRLVLDGFAYSRFGEGAPTEVPFRLAWLARQVPEHLSSDFRAGPWHQVSRVLQRMGMEHGARQIAMALEAHLRRIGRVGDWAPAAWRWLPRAGHALFGGLMGYGHRPLRLIGALGGLWLAAALVYWAAAHQGAFSPTDPQLLDNPRYAQCRADTPGVRAGAGSWARCPELGNSYPAFEPLAYSLETLLPAMNLQQSMRWTVTRESSAAPWTANAWGLIARLVSWIQALSGWAATLLLLAAASQLFSRRSEARALS